MAVFTALPESDLRAFWALYALAPLQAFYPIAEGTENSNYLIETTDEKYILTLFEQRTCTDDIPYFMRMMQHCRQQGVLCPQPIIDKAGHIIHTLAGKSAVLVSFLTGRSVVQPSVAQCASVGAALAKLHLAGQGLEVQRSNPLTLAGWQRLAAQIREKTAEGIDDIALELAFLRQHWPQALPSGLIHADLFPDNVFFDGERVSGLIDFYFSCHDFWAYDLAICVNAWAFDSPHQLNREKQAALLAGYQTVRPLQRDEQVALPVLYRGAALRFLLTRLYDKCFPKQGFVVARDPQDYLSRLQILRQV